MKIYSCPECGSMDVFTEKRGNQTALICGDCGRWIKWVGKKELSLVDRFIDSMKKGEN